MSYPADIAGRRHFSPYAILPPYNSLAFSILQKVSHCVSHNVSHCYLELRSIGLTFALVNTTNIVISRRRRIPVAAERREDSGAVRTRKLSTQENIN